MVQWSSDFAIVCKCLQEGVYAYLYAVEKIK